MRGTHQGQQSARTASTGRTHDCKRHLYRAPHDLLHSGGHPHINRRELMLLLSAGLTASRSLRAQQKAMPVIGFLTGGTPDPTASPGLTAFRQGLSEAG